MHEFISELARRAGEITLGYFRSGSLQSDAKGAWDLVTEADRASEQAITAAIRERFPDHDVFGEETGRSGTAARWLWLVDPIDGTVNFSRGLTPWGISIALAEDGQVRYGAFFDPIHDEFFYAERGGGATLNGRPIHTSGLTDLSKALVSCAVAHGPQEELSRTNVMRMWHHVMRLRMPGSVGVALAGLAAGRLDGVLEVRGGPWDYAAGGLIVSEAGGYATSFDGQLLAATTATILAAATPALHSALHAVLRDDTP